MYNTNDWLRMAEEAIDSLQNCSLQSASLVIGLSTSAETDILFNIYDRLKMVQKYPIFLVFLDVIRIPEISKSEERFFPKSIPNPLA